MDIHMLNLRPDNTTGTEQNPEAPAPSKYKTE